MADIRNAAELRDEDFADDTFKLGNRPITGIGGPIGACGDEDPVVIDLRPALQFTSLSFDLGIDVDRTETDSTDQVLVAQVVTDDSKVRVTSRATIKGSTPVSADIDGVVVVKILLFLDEAKCYDNTVTAVLSSLTFR